MKWIKFECNGNSVFLHLYVYNMYTISYTNHHNKAKERSWNSLEIIKRVGSVYLYLLTKVIINIISFPF